MSSPSRPHTGRRPQTPAVNAYKEVPRAGHIHPQEFNQDDLYVDLEAITGHRMFLKCEGFNFAGSIKLKAATAMVEAAERDGLLTPGSILVESSSGNLGVALSMIAASKGYRFVCVIDSRCNLATRLLLEALGTQIHIVTEPSPTGGLLGARIDRVRALCASDDRYVWLNQYTNPNNHTAHYRTTAPAIARAFPDLDVLFIGAGTTGTLMGCARYFRTWHRPVRIVAIDTEGSATFGQTPSRRMIPGLGTSIRPRSSTPPTSTTWYTSTKPRRFVRATNWPATASSSAAPPAPSSTAPPNGWLSRISR